MGKWSGKEDGSGEGVESCLEGVTGEVGSVREGCGMGGDLYRLETNARFGDRMWRIIVMKLTHTQNNELKDWTIVSRSLCTALSQCLVSGPIVWHDRHRRLIEPDYISLF